VAARAPASTNIIRTNLVVAVTNAPAAPKVAAPAAPAPVALPFPPAVMPVFVEAEKGSAAAQFKMGLILSAGKEVPRDF
jgi:hypothetical protein